MVGFCNGLGQSHFFPYGLLIQLALFGVFFFIVYWLIGSSGRVGKETPEEILKRRLAEGEISKKEYKDLIGEISKE